MIVVLGHAGVAAFGGGYVGVDVFFVISGFLITSLLLREAVTTGRISIARFYARRAVRLLPAASLVLVATTAAAWLWLSPIRVGEYARDAVASALYLSNVRFALVGTDYLAADAAPSPLQHFWSLAVEEQFYLVWPLLLITTLWVGRRTGRRPHAVTIGVLASVVAGSLLLSVTETERSAPWAYFGAHTRAWELGAGALLALAAPHLGRLPTAFASVLGWAGLAAVLAAAALYDKDTAFPGIAAVLPVAGTAAVIAAGCAAHRGGVHIVLRLHPCLTVGRLSYGWYLWHWPVLVIAPNALGLRVTTPVALALCAGALGLAAATYHLVENPIRHRRTLRDRPVRGIGLGLSLSAAVAVAAVLAIASPPNLPRGGRTRELAASLAAASDPAQVMATFVAAAGGVRLLPANLVPRLHGKGGRPRVYADGCHVDWPALRTGPACVYGDPASPTTVVLFGDSHAAHWFPALDQLAERRGWRLVSLSKSSCPPADALVLHAVLKRPYTECEAWRTHALRRIAELRPDVVVVGSSFVYEFADARVRGATVPAGGRAGAGDAADAAERARWSAAWARTYRALRGAGAQVATIADTPYLGERVPDCLAARPRQVDRCGRPASVALRGPLQRSIVREQARRYGMTVIDPVPWLCAETCPPILGNVLVYRDSNHLTTVFAEMMAPLVEARLPSVDPPRR